MRFTAKKIKVTHNPYAIYREKKLRSRIMRMRFTAKKKLKVTHNPYAIYREKKLKVTHNPYAIYREKN